jgi:hypothetical protein
VRSLPSSPRSVPLHAEHLLAEAHQLLVRRAPEGAKDLQVVDRFEEVGLPLPVVTHDGDPLRRDLDRLFREVAVVAEVEAGEVQGRECVSA